MLAFLLGLAMPYAALFLWGARMSPDWPRLDSSGVLALLLPTVVIPVAVGWGAAELVNLGSPRRMLDRRLRRVAVSRFMLGVAVGVLGAVAAAALLPVADRFVSDALVMGSAGGIASVGCTLLLRRIRRGHCVFCGYDLRDGPGPGRPGAGLCPECGASAMAVR